MQIIRAATARGCRIRHVHVVDLPITVHLRHELAAYRENTEVGEEVGIAVRSWHPDLGELTEDFVLFDPGSAHPAVVWMRYDDQGQLAGLAYSDKTAERQLGHVQGVAEASSHLGRVSGLTVVSPTPA